jgi:hypothetical protein
MRSFRPRWLLWLLPAAIALACSSQVSGTIALITGTGATTFTQTPLPTTLTITATDADGGVTVLSTSALPGTGDVTLPDQSTSVTAAITASATDDAGNTVIWGESLPVEFDNLEGVTLDIFVQRTGQLAVLPNPLSASVASPLLCILDGRFVLATGGSVVAEQEATQVYDLLTWTPLESPPALPVAPLSLACTGTQALLLNGTNSTFYDFSDSSYTQATAPTGGNFAEVTGGGSVPTPDGSTFIVAATNPTLGMTVSVLYMDSQENMVFAQLQNERSGAAATFVPTTDSLAGLGLVVIGGSGSAPALEVLAESAAQATSLTQFPPDSTVGAGATALDSKHILVAGGVDAMTKKDPGVRVYNLSCVPDGGTANCAPTPWNAPMVTMPSAQAFAINATSAFVVGNDASNNTHAYKVTATSATEITFNVPRKGATAVQLPTGPVAVVGGDVTMESFFVLPTGM